MGLGNPQEAGSSITLKDEGIPVVTGLKSLDMIGAGVAASGVGQAGTASIPGGGAFTTLPATGVVNGVNTTFTFTQQPTYIVSDGAWYRVNNGWTWSVLTATMSIPPNNDIYGVL